jgi:hypothetical protein
LPRKFRELEVTSIFARHHHGLEKAATVIGRLEGREEKVTPRLKKRPLPRCPEVAAMDRDALMPLAGTSTDVILPSSEPPIPVDYIPAEMFLETIGFFSPSSQRIKGIYSKTRKLGEESAPDGIKRTYSVKISAIHDLGLPITSDLDYYRAFQKVFEEALEQNEKFRLPIVFSTKKLMRYAGKQENARVKKEIRDWLKRMKFTAIEGAVYDAKTNRYREVYTSVFYEIAVKGEIRKGRVAESNSVWPAGWFLSNYLRGYVRKVDLEFHKGLRKPIAKALYPLLETGWYASNGEPFSKSYGSLCEEFLLTKHEKLVFIKRQLDPAHEELKKRGFLAKRTYRKAADGQGWIISYWPGEKYFHDQKAREQRRELAGEIQRKLSGLPAPAAQVRSSSPYLLDEILSVCGDRQNQGAYLKVIQDYPEGVVMMAVRETRQAELERRIKKSKGAFFMDTLKRLSNFHTQKMS